MSDDIRAAAERLRTVDLLDYHPSPILVINDWHILARAYLVDHPPDDDEPIDEAFLSSLGFGYCEDESILMGLDLGWAWLEVKTFPGCPEWHLGGSRMGHDAKTRGEVRRLLAALGIAAQD